MLLVNKPDSLGDMFTIGSERVNMFSNIDYGFWFKVVIFCMIISLIAMAALKPAKNVKYEENIRRNKSRLFGGGSKDLSHNCGNPNYKKGNCTNGCGSGVVHGCVMKDDNGIELVDSNGKPKTHYNPSRCRHCKNNTWCICCTGRDK